MEERAKRFGLEKLNESPNREEDLYSRSKEIIILSGTKAIRDYILYIIIIYNIVYYDFFIIVIMYYNVFAVWVLRMIVRIQRMSD